MQQLCSFIVASAVNSMRLVCSPFLDVKLTLRDKTFVARPTAFLMTHQLLVTHATKSSDCSFTLPT